MCCLFLFVNLFVIIVMLLMSIAMLLGIVGMVKMMKSCYISNIFVSVSFITIKQADRL